MVVTGRHWAVVLLLCGASVAAPVAAQQDATEAPTGFDTPTLVDKPGSRSRCVAYRNVSTYPWAACSIYRFAKRFENDICQIGSNIPGTDLTSLGSAHWRTMK